MKTSRAQAEDNITAAKAAIRAAIGSERPPVTMGGLISGLVSLYKATPIFGDAEVADLSLSLVIELVALIEAEKAHALIDRVSAADRGTKN